MATEPQPDTGPIEQPQPTVPPSEVPTLPGDIDQPAPAEEPGTGTPPPMTA